MTVSERTMPTAQRLIAERLGLDFTHQRRPALEAGLLSAWRASAATSPDQYLAWVAALPEGHPEWRRLAASLTVGETYFLRDRGCFEALEREVLPALIAARRAQRFLGLRLWSAGCATGEEPYSLAILLDRLLPDRADWHLTILGTDISTEALGKARLGVYREWALRDTPSWLRDRYFRRNGASFELDPDIRRMVSFAPLNLAGTTYPSLATNTVAMDLVLCRNVLMYFTRGMQHAVAERLQAALVPGGWLAVAPVEASAELLAPLAPVSFPGAILHAKPAIAPAPPPALPDVPTIAPATLESAFVADEASPTGAPQELPPDPRADSATTLFERARCAADAGGLEQAGELCRAAVALDRLNPLAHLLLAQIYLEQAKVDAALEETRAGIYLAPDCAPAHFLLGCLLLRRGEPRRGRRSLQTALTLLSALPPGEAVPDGDGLLAGELVETVCAYLELA